MKNAITSLITLALVSCATASTFEFRDEARPTYDKTISAEDLNALNTGDATIIDVRLSEDFASHPVLVSGAIYKDPEDITVWATSLPKDRPVIVYCVKGKWVSQKAATYLSEAGLDVYSLDGGLEAWEAQTD